MSSHAAAATDTKLAGDHDDPDPVQSSYYMLLLFVFMAGSIFAGTWLALEWMEQVNEEKGPSHAEHNELERVWDHQDADLSTSLQGDVLTLKDGTKINEGVVVQFTDKKGKQWVMVKTARYALDRENHIRELLEDSPELKSRGDAERRLVELDLMDKTKDTAALGTKELKFTPGEVDLASIAANRGKGKLLCVPIDEGMSRYLKDRK